MPIRKHDTTVVLEILGAFAIVAIISIAFILSLLVSELKKSNAIAAKAPAAISAPAAQNNKKIGTDDLDPEFLQALGQGFQQTQIALGQSNQEIGFFMNKILEKNFSKEEITSLRSEYDAQIKAAQEAAKAQAAKAQAQAQGAPAVKEGDAAPAQ